MRVRTRTTFPARHRASSGPWPFEKAPPRCFLVIGVNRFLLQFLLFSPFFQHDDCDDVAIGIKARSNFGVCGPGDTIDDGLVPIDLPVRSGVPFVFGDVTSYLFIVQHESLNKRIDIIIRQHLPVQWVKINTTVSKTSYSVL